MMSDYKVETINDSMQEFYVDFHGPKDSKSSIPIFDFSHFCDLLVVFLVNLGLTPHLSLGFCC